MKWVRVKRCIVSNFTHQANLVTCILKICFFSSESKQWTETKSPGLRYDFDLICSPSTLFSFLTACSVSFNPFLYYSLTTRGSQSNDHTLSKGHRVWVSIKLNITTWPKLRLSSWALKWASVPSSWNQTEGHQSWPQNLKFWFTALTSLITKPFHQQITICW